MYAIIETGGKQYRVENGESIKIEKLNAEEGSVVVFDKVLAAGEGADIKVGTPYLDGLTVEGKVVGAGKREKVIIFKYKSKKDYRKKQGHRQPYTEVEIISIAGEKAAPKKEEPKAEAPAEDAKPLDKMLKSELVEYAKEKGIEVDEKGLKADILEAIKAAE
ncbi:MAG: 50S ribosomal protein L21 [Firmicutes bacterium]|nr:50S ribosomal protein L21 [Bacillota bacterium]